MLVGYVKATHTRVTLLFLLAVVLADSVVPLAFAETQSEILNTQGWVISVNLTNPNQPAGSTSTVTLDVSVTQTVYDLQITLSGQGLTFSNNLGSGNSYTWNQLNQGDNRQIQFTVTTPSQAPIGNVYNMTVDVQSYATPPGPFGIRAPFDSPNNIAKTGFLLQIVPAPIVIQPNGSGVDWGAVMVVALVAFAFVVLMFYLLSKN